jgi:hypothetical protein
MKGGRIRGQFNTKGKYGEGGFDSGKKRCKKGG